ncbi:MAG: type II toxin-antitoxin system HicB family antitoxin [Deltaproteobacteria bacterium]|nr:type II toxin-antitoxin system HicB family antitoxin [Deltaproteobacteria bacterium]
MKHHRTQEYHVIIERDEDGYFVGDVPELPGCHTQAKSLDQLMARIQEAIRLYLEAHSETHGSEFVGVQRVAL